MKKIYFNDYCLFYFKNELKYGDVYGHVVE